MTKKTRTGFCSAGLCEGTKPRSPSDKPLKTCEFWQDCACKCHVELTAMFEMTGNERVTVYNSEYKPEKSPFLMPSISVAPSHEESAGSPESIPVSDDMSGLSGNVQSEFKSTPSGRKARGELEHAVLQVVERWLAPDSDITWEFCTPVLVAQAIDEDRPPSTGAINAIFARWERMGFAEINKKPIRLVELKRHTSLSELKNRIRHERIKAASRQRRGVRV